MESPAAKGTVTSFASMFPVDEAQKAAKRVEEAIEEKQKEMERVKHFIADNTALVNLVSKLPDELHHDIMVPFGKAAFFPGRLIHTNEFLVLLGEGYFAERTAKQTVEILKRRGKALDSQVESLRANVRDLKAEASFFGATASEAAEGLVEIREDYVEENSNEGKLKSDGKKATVEDDEYARIMSRLDELEKEELAAEGDNENDEEEESNTTENENESDRDEQTYVAESDSESGNEQRTQMKDDMNKYPYHNFSEMRRLQQQRSVEDTTVEPSADKYHHQLGSFDQSNCTGLMVQPLTTDGDSNSKTSTHDVKKSLPAEKILVLPEVKEQVITVSSPMNKLPVQTSGSLVDSSKAFTGSIAEYTDKKQTNLSKKSVSFSETPAQTSRAGFDSSKTPAQTSRAGFDSSKAFTGSIVEHAHNLQTSREQAATSSQNSQPSRPVSRFKMQRR